MAGATPWRGGKGQPTAGAENFRLLHALLNAGGTERLGSAGERCAVLESVGLSVRRPRARARASGRASKVGRSRTTLEATSHQAGGGQGRGQERRPPLLAGCLGGVIPILAIAVQEPVLQQVGTVCLQVRAPTKAARVPQSLVLCGGEARQHRLM